MKKEIFKGEEVQTLKFEDLKVGAIIRVISRVSGKLMDHGKLYKDCRNTCKIEKIEPNRFNTFEIEIQTVENMKHFDPNECFYATEEDIKIYESKRS